MTFSQFINEFTHYLLNQSRYIENSRLRGERALNGLEMWEVETLFVAAHLLVNESDGNETNVAMFVLPFHP